MDGGRIIHIGRIDFRNDDRVFGIKDEDRFSHVYVIGKTGTGKSTLLETMALRDLERGNGFALVDPHGDLVARVAARIPASYRDKVIYLDATDPTQPTRCPHARKERVMAGLWSAIGYVARQPSCPESASWRVPGDFFCTHHVDQADAVVFAPDVAEPMTDIAPKHERIRGGVSTLLLVGDEACERNRGKLHLLGRHLNKLRDLDLDRLMHPLEVGRVGCLVPFEEIRVVDEILYHEIFRVAEIVGGFRDLVERGDRGPENMEDDEGDVALLRRVDEADVAQSAQRR